MTVLLVFKVGAIALLSFGTSAEHTVSDLDTAFVQVGAEVVWRFPEPRCVGDRAKFDAGFGECEVYTHSRNNHAFCHRDLDEAQGFYARQVCRECEACQGPPGEKIEASTSEQVIEDPKQTPQEIERKARAMEKTAERKDKEAFDRFLKQMAHSTEKARAERKARAMETEKRAQMSEDRRKMQESGPCEGAWCSSRKMAQALGPPGIGKEEAKTGAKDADAAELSGKTSEDNFKRMVQALGPPGMGKEEAKTGTKDGKMSEDNFKRMVQALGPPGMGKEEAKTGAKDADEAQPSGKTSEDNFKRMVQALGLPRMEKEEAKTGAKDDEAEPRAKLLAERRSNMVGGPNAKVEGTKRKSKAEAAEREARKEIKAKEAELKAKAEEVTKLKKEAAERKAQEAESKSKAEAERKAQEEAESKVKAEAERKARQEGERMAKEEIERKAQAEDRDRTAKEEAERNAEQEAKLKEKAQEVAKLKTEVEAEHKAEGKGKDARRSQWQEAEEAAVQEVTEHVAKQAAKREWKMQVKREWRERRAQKDIEEKAKEEAERMAEEAKHKAKREVARQRKKELKIREDQAHATMEEKLARAREEETAARMLEEAAATLTSTSLAPREDVHEVSRHQAIKAVGDPHLVNMYGQRFDILQSGNHTLLQIPRHAVDSNTLLHVDANVKHIGSSCAEMYFRSVSVAGKWAQDLANSLGHGPLNTGRFHFHADSPNHGNTTQWTRFGHALDLKVIWGRTSSGIHYLNLLVRHLDQLKYPIGGILGEDDHTDAATPRSECKRQVSLLSIASVSGSSSAAGGRAFRERDQAHGSIAEVVDA